MKKIFFIVTCVLFPMMLINAQSRVETVGVPQYADFDIEFIGSDNEVSQTGDLNVSATIIKHNKENSVTKDTAIEITTEIGTTTIVQATTTSRIEEPLESLSDVVSRINDRYEEESASCEVGSWFARIWCRITSWFS